MNHRSLATGVVTIVSLFTFTASADIINVTTDDDLAAKIASANPGDEVVLADGTYGRTAEITIDKSITVRGTTREGTIITRTSGTIRLFTLKGGATLQNMTIQNGNRGGSGGNILIQNGTVDNCIVQDGTNTGGNGQGGSNIAVYDGAGSATSSAIIRNSIIRRGISSGLQPQNNHSGYGVWCRKTTSVLIENCIIGENIGYGGFNVSGAGTGAGLGVYQDGDGVVVKNCTFYKNAGPGAGALYSNKNTAIVTNCVFVGNMGFRGTEEKKDISGTFKSVQYCAFDENLSSAPKNSVEGQLLFRDPENYDFTPVSGANVAIGAAADGSDLGAVQHEANPAPAVYVACDINEATAVPFTAHFTGYTEGTSDSIAWSLNDSPVSSGNSANCSFTESGTYTVTATAGSVSKSFTITAAQKNFAVSSVAELNTAIAAAGNGSVITLAAGDYVFSSGVSVPAWMQGSKAALYIDKGITLRGGGADPSAVTLKMNGHTAANLKSTPSNSMKIRIALLTHPNAKIENLTFFGGKLNDPFHYGAGCYIDYKGGSVSNCVFDACACFNNQGGGAGLAALNGLATHCVFKNSYSKLNNNDGSGGIVLLFQKAVVRNSLVTGNDGEANSGYSTLNCTVGLYGSSLLESCTVAGNTCWGCAGVRQYESTATVRNCQIQNNFSSGYNADNPIRNDVFAAQKTVNKVVVYDSAAAAKFINCATPLEIVDATNCQHGEMPVKNSTDGDWHPVFGSVALENGLVQPWMTGATDLDGNPRLSEGNNVDIGCYQFKKAAVNGSFTPSKIEWRVPADISFTATVQSEAGTITGYIWNFGDGSAEVETVVPSTSHTYNTIGEYAPMLKVMIGSDEYSIPYAGTINIGPDVIYVTNDPDAAEGAYPYGNWQSATKTISNAVARAVTGTRIVLKRGAHTNNFDTAIEKDIVLEGETTNPFETIMERKFVTSGSDSITRCITLASQNAIIRNLTIAGGAIQCATTTDGANLRILAQGGTVTNCVITRGQIVNGSPNGSNGAGATISGGLITHCVFSNNLARLAGNDNGTGGAILRLRGGQAEYCLFVNNLIDDHLLNTNNSSYAGHYSSVVRLSGGKIYNSTIVSNDVQHGWAISTVDGYSGSGLIVNCLVALNRSVNLDAAATAKVASSGAFACMRNCAGDAQFATAGDNYYYAADMFFKDSAAGNFRPNYKSVAANHGDKDVVQATRDLAGNLVKDSRGRVDIGCYAKYGSKELMLLLK